MLDGTVMDCIADTFVCLLELGLEDLTPTFARKVGSSADRSMKKGRPRPLSKCIQRMPGLLAEWARNEVTDV
jgi:hypothetical protein